MSASEFERDRADLDEAIRTQRLVARTADEAVERLLRTAFRDAKVVERFRDQVEIRGSNRALAIAQGRDDLPRWLWLSRLRGGFFNREDRIQAEAALAELPAALNDASRQEERLRDLMNTRERLVSEHDRQTTREHVEERQRERERDPAYERGNNRGRIRDRR